MLSFTRRLCECLPERAQAPAFIFLDGSCAEQRTVTSAEIHADACAVAGALAQRYPRGTRVLILQPPGYDFMRSLLGCMYAGMIAVPSYPARRREPPARLMRVRGDSGARCVLTHSSLSERSVFPGCEGIDTLVLDRLALAAGYEPELDETSRDTVAYLQYTSGSTSAPRGVMVTHGNLLDNSAVVDRVGGGEQGRVIVNWLPPYHDFGLVTGYLQPLYSGALGIVMAPATFAQRPVRWLEVMTRYRATGSGGPNFAYSLCARTVSDAQLEGLDLREWKVASLGSEQTDPNTLREFTARFAPVGFNPRAFAPGYGLAEATLMVSSALPDEWPLQISIEHAGDTDAVNIVSPDAPESAAHKRFTLVEVGAMPAHVAIVDPCTREPLPDGAVGEIWVTGASVSPGYWNQPELTRETMGNLIAGSTGPAYLRTGDLGLVHAQRLFFVSRLKDIVIVHGQNFYPADLEAVASRAHPRLNPGRAAAFSVVVDRQERLVIALELSREGWQSASVDEICAAVTANVEDEFGLVPHDIALLRPHSIPQTLNGKVARHRVKDAYNAGSLARLASADHADRERLSL